MKRKQFVVLYEWHTGQQSYHGFDTIEEALRDRECYVGSESFPIYQLVKEEQTCYLPGGGLVTRVING